MNNMILPNSFIKFESRTYKKGMKQGKLTILSTWKIPHKSYHFIYYAFCQCDCGSNPKYIQINAIRSGKTISCGCSKITHNGCWHPLYKTWNDMMQRCFNPKLKAFHNYGGRGITVCERWQNPINFFEDMENTFQKGLQIERIDNNGNYCPENCKWATSFEQRRNSRQNNNIAFNGKILCLADWAKEIGIKYTTLQGRFRRGNWSIEKILTTPKLSKFERAKLGCLARSKKIHN